MPPQYQKQLKAVVHRWQQGLAITIGPFEPLNYETATNVCSVSATVLMLFALPIHILKFDLFSHFIAHQENLLAFDAAFFQRQIVPAISFSKKNDEILYCFGSTRVSLLTSAQSSELGTGN